MFALLIVAGNETTRQAISLGTLALLGIPMSTRACATIAR